MSRPLSFDEGTALKKAMLFFWKNGFSNSSIRQLELFTGLSISSLYNKFQSKDELFDRALEFYIENVVKRRVETYLKNENKILGLIDFFESTFENVEVPTYPKSCLLVKTALDTQALSRISTVKILERGAKIIEDAFEESLRGAQREDSECKKYSAKAWSKYLANSLNGLLVEINYKQDKKNLKESVDNIFEILPFKHFRG